jgi:hypothetical protein
MSSGHLVGRRIQPRFNLVVVLRRHDDEELGALVDVSEDRDSCRPVPDGRGE